MTDKKKIDEFYPFYNVGVKYCNFFYLFVRV